MEQNPRKNFWVANKCYRSRPPMYQPLIVNDYLADISGVNLHLFSLDKFQLVKSIPVLEKDDQYCAKLRKINNQFIAIFGMTKFYIVSVVEKKVVQFYNVQNFIQVLQVASNYIGIITTDQDQERKMIHSWKISPLGKVQKKYEPVQVSFPDYQDCTQENIHMTIIMSIDHSPRIYIFWKGTNQMVEVDPIRRQQEKYSRTNPITFVSDLDGERYAEIHGNKILINSKKGGKEVAQIINEGQVFIKLYSNPNQKDQLYTVSNKGLKRWLLQKNAVPVSFQSSQKYQLKDIYFDSQNNIYGINSEARHIVGWKIPTECTIHNFPHQEIKRILVMNKSQICILIQATASRQQQNQFHVEKFNKMQVYDLEHDIQVAKKGVQKFEYRIDIDSAIVSQGDTIRFILNQQLENQVKKYIFRWSPFIEDKKKQIKKREIVGSKNYNLIKIYPFDRILTLTLAKEGQTYSLFGKTSQSKNQIGLFDFSAKKFADYDILGSVKNVEMNSQNQLYVIGQEKLSVYKIDQTLKNRLEKIHELEVCISSLTPFGDYILIRRESTLSIYDNEFQLVMREQLPQNSSQSHRVMKVSDKKFVLNSGSGFNLFDLQSQQFSLLKDIPNCEPNLSEIIQGRIVVANKWIRAYTLDDLSQN